MKKILTISVIAVVAFSGAMFAESGKALFTQKGCVACHNPTKDQAAMGLGPAIKQVAKAYKGDKAGLVNFLKGNGKPRVYPDKFPTMKGQIAMIKGMSDAQFNAIADFILKH